MLAHGVNGKRLKLVQIIALFQVLRNTWCKESKVIQFTAKASLLAGRAHNRHESKRQHRVSLSSGDRLASRFAEYVERCCWSATIAQRDNTRELNNPGKDRIGKDGTCQEPKNQHLT